jgi:hypothetical protein
VNALTRQPSESVQKAGVNQGATRGPLIIQSADTGARSKVVGTQAFDSNGRVTFSPQAIEAAKKDLKAARVNEIRLSHKLPANVELSVSNKSYVSFSRVHMDNIYGMHAESISADPQTRKANLRAIKEREARFERLKNGLGNVDDLIAKRNALLA